MKALLLILLSIGTAASATAPNDNFTPLATAKAKYNAWNIACFYTVYVCDGVPVPKVVRERMEGGLQGYYDGSDTIFVRSGLTGIREREVLVHEMIHYLQAQNWLEVPGYAEPICRAEMEAFTVVDEWLVASGNEWLVVGPDWWKVYPHCWQFYDPNWPQYSEQDKLIWTLDPDEG